MDVNEVEIHLKDIVKLQKLYIEIFEEQDSDHVDGRVIVSKEKAVQRILNRITNNSVEQSRIWKIIEQESWNTRDRSFKPICDRLRNFGFKIIKELK